MRTLFWGAHRFFWKGRKIMKKMFLMLAVLIAAQWGFAADRFVGEYKGVTESAPGYFKENPTVYIQISKPALDIYKVRVLPFLARRAAYYAEFEVKDDGSDIIRFENQGQYKIGGYIDAKTGMAELAGINGKVPFKMKFERFERVSPTMGLKAPADAVWLIGNGTLDAWVYNDNTAPDWTILGDVAEINPHNPAKGEKKQNRTIKTKETFKDFKLHIEFKLPEEFANTGQARGNSGLFIGPFEVQILDSFHSGAYWNECSALYQFMPPQVDASLPPERWQTYDIEFTAARFKDGKLETYPVITVYHNGIKVQSNVCITQATSHIQTKAEGFVFTDEAYAISLQDHDHKVQFRNMWIAPLGK